MNILAFDTCLGACSAAVRWRGSTGPGPGETGTAFLAWRRELMTAGHAERLMPMIDEVMREAGRGFESLDAIAVTEGPGTFTGVRVGIAAARGLALATGLPIVATTSLHAMAHEASGQLGRAEAGGMLGVAVDARAGHVFMQTFAAGSGAVLTPASLMRPDDAARLRPDLDLVCVGSGAPLVAAAAQRAGRVVEVALVDLQPDARALAELAPALAPRKPLLPLYLRAPDAKPQTGRSVPRLRASDA